MTIVSGLESLFVTVRPPRAFFPDAFQLPRTFNQLVMLPKYMYVLEVIRKQRTYPLIAKAIGLSAQCSDALDSDKLAAERFPKIISILVWLQAWVSYRDQRLVVRHLEDVAVVETAVLFRRRLDGFLSDDVRSFTFENNGLDLVTAGDHTDVARVDELGEIKVVLVGAVLGDVTVDSDQVACRDVCKSILAEDINTAAVSQRRSMTSLRQILPLRGAVIVVRLRRADPKPIGTLGSDKTSHIHNT
jgi:hypothetical protein